MQLDDRYGASNFLRVTIFLQSFVVSAYAAWAFLRNDGGLGIAGSHR